MTMSQAKREPTMTAIPMLTRDIGQAERTLRALLEGQLRRANLSFPEWVVLVMLDNAGPLEPDDLVERQLAGRVAPEPEARAAVETLRGNGLLGEVDGGRRLAISAAGDALFGPLAEAVTRLSGELYADLPIDDLEATQRTLNVISHRANERLAELSG